jgi:hypothetical protein
MSKLVQTLLVALMIVVLLALSALLAIATAYAQDRPLHQELALAVARVAANEASRTVEEVDLIWQVTEGRASTTAGRLRWLRRHSPCATGVLSQAEADARPGNCRWTRNLNRDLREPAGWPEGYPWAAYRENWRRRLARASNLVRGQSLSVPCAETPWTWGGRALNVRDARRRGLVPVWCKDTSNTGYRRI